MRLLKEKMAAGRWGSKNVTLINDHVLLEYLQTSFETVDSSKNAH